MHNKLNNNHDIVINLAEVTRTQIPLTYNVRFDGSYKKLYSSACSSESFHRTAICMLQFSVTQSDCRTMGTPIIVALKTMELNY